MYSNMDNKNEFKKTSQIGEVWRRLKKNKAAMLGLVIISIFILLAVFADVIADYDELAIQHNMSIRLQPPSKEHIFGTDHYGRDVFARIIHGGRISLSIGIITTAVSVFFGAILGSIAGFYGGRIDDIITRFTDAVMCIPAILLALCVVSALGNGMTNLVIAISISQIPGFTRVIRSVILTLRDQDYIRAARSCGTSDARIIYKHILPNAIGPIIVQATMAISNMILTAAGLSFIGMGVAAPAPEWGTMLSEAREQIRYAPYLIAFPGIAIVLNALSFNLLGDGLRDALDPRLKD